MQENKYIKKVTDYQPELLPRPQKKDDGRTRDGTRIITIDTGLWSSSI